MKIYLAQNLQCRRGDHGWQQRTRALVGQDRIPEKQKKSVSDNFVDILVHFKPSVSYKVKRFREALRQYSQPNFLGAYLKPLLLHASFL